MKAEPQENIFEEIRQLKRRLSIVERKAAALQKPKLTSVRKAFRRKYPHVHISPPLFRLVGIDPPLSLAEEKKELWDVIAERFDRK
jgi:hypothetical protein